MPAGADLELDVQLEGVTEGVLVTATATVPLAGECARCLEPFTSATKVRFQELFTLGAGGGRRLRPAGRRGQLPAGWSGPLDLEPALRDALVLELPLSPLCEDDCARACASSAVSGWRRPGPDHGHEQRGGCGRC